MVVRHFAWFNVQTGAWIGEWCGAVPTPMIPASVVAEARLALLNEWLQAVQRWITPNGSPYEAQAQAWNLDAWDDCPAGGAVCLDVTLYNWPVGDFVWAVFDAVDRRLSFLSTRKYLQVTPARLELDSNSESPRPVRSTAEKYVLDITGTPLEAFHGRLYGTLVRRRGAIVLESWRSDAPAEIGQSTLVQRALETARVNVYAVPEGVKKAHEH